MLNYVQVLKIELEAFSSGLEVVVVAVVLAERIQDANGYQTMSRSQSFLVEESILNVFQKKKLLYNFWQVRTAGKENAHDFLSHNKLWVSLANSFPWGTGGPITEVKARDMLAKLITLYKHEDDLFFAADSQRRTLLWRAVYKRDNLAVDAILKAVVAFDAHPGDLLAWFDTTDTKSQLTARNLAFRLGKSDLADAILQSRTIILERGYGSQDGYEEVKHDPNIIEETYDENATNTVYV
mmetsp:Transcript_2082/g.2749  ORF Transcript_2082/g.2749 Transcript_2082/m.2749 type:complete len:239 (+) Transcript_2082:920-1636(+)